MGSAKEADANLQVSASRCLDSILSLVPINDSDIPKERTLSIVEVGELDG